MDDDKLVTVGGGGGDFFLLTIKNQTAQDIIRKKDLEKEILGRGRKLHPKLFKTCKKH